MDFEELVNKFLAILMSLFDALGSGISFGHGGSTDGSFGSFGEVQVTIPPARADKIFDAFAGHVPSAPQFLNAPAPIPTCRSAVCIEYADSVVRNLKPDSDPCVGLYGFACGGIAGQNVSNVETVSTRSKKRHSSLTKVQAMKQLREVLEFRGPQRTGAKSKLQKLYSACTNQDSSADSSINSLKSMLATATRGWPVISHSWNTSDFSLYSSLIETKKLGVDALFQWSIRPDPENPNNIVVRLGNVILGLKQPALYDDPSNEAATTRKAYRELIEEVVYLLSDDMDDSSTQSKQIQDLLDFEKSLAKAASLTFGSSDVVSTINHIGLSVPTPMGANGRFEGILQAVFKDLNVTAHIDGSTKTIGKGSEFFRDFNVLLENANGHGADGRTVLANYIGWNLILPQLLFMPRPFRMAMISFMEKAKTLHKGVDSPDWLRCVEFVNSAMPEALWVLYVDKFMDPPSRSKVNEILRGIKAELMTYVQSISWMSEAAKVTFVEKLRILSSRAWLPDRDVSFAQLNELYKNVAVTDHHFHNVQSLSRFSRLRQLRRLGQTSDGSAGEDEPWFSAHVCPEYIRATFAGELQLPAFSVSVPDYVNYAGLGFFFARSLLRDMFEDFDKNQSGLLQTAPTATNCFASTLFADELGKKYQPNPSQVVPSPASREESKYADGVAFDVSYKAYRDRTPVEKVALPGLERYSAEKLFVIAFAQNWCEEGSQSPENVATTTVGAHKHAAPLLLDLPPMHSGSFSGIFNCTSNSTLKLL